MPATTTPVAGALALPPRAKSVRQVEAEARRWMRKGDRRAGLWAESIKGSRNQDDITRCLHYFPTGPEGFLGQPLTPTLPTPCPTP